MKWVEVIRLRTSGEKPGIWEESFLKKDNWTQNGLVQSRVFRHAALESDLSIHLYWDSQGPGKNGSDLGLLLAQALKHFGLIDHSVWIEVEK
jgi:hypothetical protein